MALEIRAINSPGTNKDFMELPWDLHGSDSNWVPPLRIAVKDLLDPKKNPFFSHAKIQAFVAYKDGRRVGRIVGVVDDNHNKFHEEKAGFWGFFEAINDQEVATKLLEAASSWVKSQGMTVIRGPMNPNTNAECGMQISAFDTQPYVMMTQNPPYYPQLVEKAGFAKAKDLYAWIVSDKCKFDEKLVARAKAAADQADVKFRTLDMSRYDEEVETMLKVYNDAWEKNWGFVPMTDEEFRHMAKDMKQILNPKLVFIVEVKGEPAGFSVLLPDVNQVLIKIRDGKLFPTGLLKLLWHTKVKKDTINRGRIAVLGIRKKFQAYGLANLMYMRYLEIGPKNGAPVAECSWVLEDNVAMNKGLQYMNANMYKTYRIYEKTLN